MSQDARYQNRAKVIMKHGSSRLYVRLNYHGQRIVKSSGLVDTRENRALLREAVDAMNNALNRGTFVFAGAFPGTSDEQKTFFSEKEGS
jgi:integrase